MKFEFERKVEGEAESSKVSVQVELFKVPDGQNNICVEFMRLAGSSLLF